MNHHLRFPAISAALLAGVLLSSCSSTPEIPPLAADPQHELTYEIQIFELPLSEPFQGPATAILSSEEGERLLQQQKTEATFSKKTAGRSGQTRTLSNFREFVYPSEYTPPQFSKGNTHTSFPVTPATPKAFEKTNLGSRVSISGKKTQTAKVDLSVSINQKVLLGFQNYGKPIMTEGTDFWGKTVPIMITENRIEMPLFSNKTVKIDEELAEGQYLVIRGKGHRASPDAKPPLAASRGSDSPDFIAFVRVAIRP